MTPPDKVGTFHPITHETKQHTLISIISVILNVIKVGKQNSIKTKIAMDRSSINNKKKNTRVKH